MSLLAFASGFAKATGAAALKEDERRAELSKEAYTEAMKRRDAALAIAKEQQDEFKKQRDYINSVRGMQVDGYVVSAAEASELYKLTEGDVAKIDDVVKSGLIKIRNAGELKATTGATEWSPEVPKMEGAEEESSILFGSRTDAVNKKIQDRMSGSTAVTGAPTLTATGVQRGSMSTKDADSGQLKNPNYNWSVDIPDGKGGFTTVTAVQSSSGLHVLDSSGAPVKPPEGWTNLRKNSTKTEEVEKLHEATATLNKLISASTEKKLTEASDKRGAVVSMGQNYTEMAEYALDRAVYGTGASIIDSLTEKAKAEVAGIVLLAKGEGGDDKQDTDIWFQKLEEVDQYLNSIDGTGIAAKKRRMEALALKLAINDLVTSGDSRPSDMDVKLRMRMYLAKSPEEFLLQSKNNLRMAEQAFAGAVVKLQEDGSLNKLRGLASRSESDTVKEAAGLLIESYTTVEDTSFERPEFLKRAEEEGQDAVIRGEAQQREGVEVSLKRGGSTVAATYDPNTDTYSAIDRNGKRRTLSGKKAVEDGWISKEEHLKLLQGE